MYNTIPQDKSVLRKFTSYFTTKTYIVGTQKNRLNETVLLIIQNIMFKLMDKKIITILCLQNLHIRANALYIHVLVEYCGM